MSFDPKAPSPLVCVPEAIPAAQRNSHFALSRRLFREAAAASQAIEGGYAFRFDAAAFDDVARYVSNERRCCPFFRFEIEVGADGGPVWLRLTGPAAAQEMLAGAVRCS